MKTYLKFCAFVGLALFLLSACGSANDLGSNAPLNPDFYTLTLSPTPFQPIPWTLTPSPTLTPSATQGPTPTPSPTITPSPTPAPYSIWIDPMLPEGVLNNLYLPAEIGLADESALADWQLQVGGENPISQWVYVLVAPFPTLTDGVSSEALLAAWQGESGVEEFEGQPLLMAESTLSVLITLWGEPAPNAVRSVAPGNLVEKAWGSRPSWAIIPFEELNPQWKVLTIDGVSPIHKDFEISDYDLVVPISLTGEAPVSPVFPSSNRDPEKLTVLAMTGVTALVRATAYSMELRGVTYPAQDVGKLLREADITHISNEVPFAEDCPFPDPVQEGMQFCSAERYIELLEEVGTDVVELTGDHFADWGADAMLFTLGLYDERGWLFYGGGENLQKGRKPILLEHNGNKLALIGCNAKGGSFAQASESNPGAVACDWEWISQAVKSMRTAGYLPIVTFQHFEYYTYNAQENQIRDAERMTEAGAVIVSGSQAHQPQAFEFSNGGFVHHGLGNLFFDQFDVSDETRLAFIDLHVFYAGQHISTELVTIIFVDYARPRLMTPEERVQLLQAVFEASGW